MYSRASEKRLPHWIFSCEFSSCQGVVPFSHTHARTPCGFLACYSCSCCCYSLLLHSRFCWTSLLLISHSICLPSCWVLTICECGRVCFFFYLPWNSVIYRSYRGLWESYMTFFSFYLSVIYQLVTLCYEWQWRIRYVGSALMGKNVTWSVSSYDTHTYQSWLHVGPTWVVCACVCV